MIVAPLVIHVKIVRMSEIGSWMVFISTMPFLYPIGNLIEKT
jgi:hypothetical protein